MTDDLVGRLQQRMAAASEQPWVYRPMEYDDWGFIRGIQRDDRGIGPFRPVVAIARNSTIRTQQENEHREAGTDPYGPNALLIVEAVNALPTLLARIEALEGALKLIAACNQERTWTATDDNPESHWVKRDGQYAKIARAALAKDKSHG